MDQDTEPIQPTPREVAYWRHTIQACAGSCIQAAPDPADPRSVAAYNQARAELAAQLDREPEAQPHP